ncbi:MAG: ribose transport system substrate-binding protein, partial [Chloroflexi bacterium]|nr:ribose transport system substrate-binding protein [Chloroflexota bacterium]
MPALPARFARRRAAAAWSVLAVTVALLVGACAVPDASPTSTPAPTATPAVNPYDSAGAVAGSGSGVKLGYISYGDIVPFVKSVSDGIREQAEVAGAELFECDAALDQEKLRTCLKQVAESGVKGVILFQPLLIDPAEACGLLPATMPVIAVEYEHPCQKAYVGADDTAGGEIAGKAVGAYAKTEWGCTYDALVTLGSATAPERAQRRLDGFRRGLQTACEVKNEQHQSSADREDNSKVAVAGVLDSLTGATRILVAGMNDDGVLGALSAAADAGRQNAVFVSGQGGDSRVLDLIRAGGQYIGDAAYRPERYGRTIVPAMLDAIAG